MLDLATIRLMRAFVYAVLADAAIAVLVLHDAIKSFLWTHPWWHSFLVAVPTMALPIIAILELRHSGEIVELTKQKLVLQKELDTERNKQLGNLGHLGQIAEHIKPPTTVAEKNAAKLLKHKDQMVSIFKDGGHVTDTPQIVEISDDNIVSLFFPVSMHMSSAELWMVDCAEVEIVDFPHGSCPIRMNVNKLHGPAVRLGEITRWEDRHKPTAKPTIEKGQMAWRQNFIKVNSPEKRDLIIFGARDGSNAYILEAQPIGVFTGDNVEISKRASSLRIDYLNEGFKSGGYGTGISAYPIYLERI